MNNNADNEKSFETSLSELETIVRELDRGEMPLEKSLELFEQGVKLVRECRERLSEAERRVEVLTRGLDDRFETQPYADEEEELEMLATEPEDDDIPF